MMINGILTIAKREIGRLRSRFRSGSRQSLFFIFAGSLVIGYLLSRQGTILGEGIYRVGVSPRGPEISDGRFNTTTMDHSRGLSMLEEKALDAYIDESQVASRNDTRSLYAVGALKRYLKKLELERIIGQHDIDSAFPLRVEVNYLPIASGSDPTASGPALSELIDSAMGGRPELMETTPKSSDEVATQASSGAPQPHPQSPLLESQEDTDSAVRAQIREMDVGDVRPRIAMEFTSHKDIIIPSLMNPPMPFAQVILAFIYVLPVTFLSVFFTGSFMSEKTDRRIAVLMSAPVTPFQIIVGKMLPYIGFSIASVIVMTFVLGGNVLVALAIFIPIILFIFAIYLMVPLVYRTFRDTTFVSMLAITLITSYLIFPAMFSGINDLCYISPLTLAVKMYRGESFGLREYGVSTLPMVLMFVLSMYVGTRILNEEYLMGYRPLHRKVADAVYLVIDRRHLYLSIMLLSLFLIPIVYMMQLVILAVQFNMPIRYTVGGLLFVAVVVEEIAKSVGILVLLENRVIRTMRSILMLSFVSAASFLIGEKLLLFISLRAVSESAVFAGVLNSGVILVPLLAHFLFTTLVCSLTRLFGARYYLLAVLAGSVIHALYNFTVIGVIPWDRLLR